MTTDRENDARIARDVMNLTTEHLEFYTGNGPGDHIPHYSTDDASAFSALDKLGLDYEIAGKVGDGHCCKIIVFNGGEIVLRVARGDGSTRPAAIVQAIIAFLDSKAKQEAVIV